MRSASIKGLFATCLWYHCKEAKENCDCRRNKKKVTFHVSRHTFATMMLTAGADLYTISKLIGHADIRTTQIYSKVVDKKKQKAVALLDSMF
ncbi:MAG: tyrosine-type recombinase/integrase [Muribaculaceae bacterium]|nr:tyrosine-type recombinase/integrase [Muribaculaceae bacterium]